MSPRRWALTTIALLLAAAAVPALARDARPGAGGLFTPAPEPLDCGDVGRLMGQFLQRHLTHETLSPELRERVARSYLQRIDPQRTLYLAPEAEALVGSLAPAVGEVRSGSCDSLHDLHAEVTQRLVGEEAFVRALVESDGYDVDRSATLQLDPEDRGWPADPAARDRVLRALTHFQVANYLTGDLPLDEARERIAHRYELRTRRWAELSRGEVYESFLDAFAQSLDPHSDYFSADDLEDFKIDMQLSLEGIGVSLSERDGYAVVEAIIPGGAAAKVDALRPKDRIIGVAESDGEFVDVIDMRLREIVRLIRGKKGSPVRLAVLRSGDEPERLEVTIVRDKIDLKEQAAKLRFEAREVGGETLKLAVLDLPSFYGDQDPRKRQGSQDVARLLAEAREAGADGLVLDLSRNGGGLLDDAVRISGFFIREGGIVSVGANGASRAHPDPDRGILWSGPMVVLISRVSASASEILAGALKDYDRAVIVGDDHTFGKGTVQSVVQLADPPGALKVTTARYFRPSGSSTQNAGVQADVVVPSPFNLESFGEGTHPHALPGATTRPFVGGRANGGGNGERWQRVTPATIRELQARSKARQEASDDFQKLHELLAKRAEDDGVVELSSLLDGDGEEETAATALPESPEAAAGAAGGAGAEGNGDASPSVEAAQVGEEAEGEGEDAPNPQLEEALGVLADLVLLQRGAPLDAIPFEGSQEADARGPEADSPS